MRILLGILLSLSLFSCEHIIAPSEQPRSNPTSLQQDAYPNPDSTFNVHNLTSINVGSVSVALVDSSSVSIAVGGAGNFSTRIPTNPMSCLVHGTSLPYSTTTWIAIDTHVSVRATWLSNIVVIDETEEN